MVNCPVGNPRRSPPFGPLQVSGAMLGRIGFIGTGKIANAIVDGIVLRCPQPQPITVSPRGSRAQTLLQRYPQHVQIAADNQAVLDMSDTIFLALRPRIQLAYIHMLQVHMHVHMPAADAIAALQNLHFTPQTLVVSLMHGISPHAIASAARGVDATAIVRVNPLPACASGHGITALCPPHPSVSELFGRLGAVHPVDTLDELHVLHAASTLMGPLFELMRTASVWAASADGNGSIDERAAQRYMSDLLAAIAAEASAETGHPGGGFSSLVAQQTRGGLNEANIRRLRDAGTFEAVHGALAATLRDLHKAN